MAFVQQNGEEILSMDVLIVKEPLLGVAAVLRRRPQGGSFVSFHPVTISWEGCIDSIDLEDGDRVVGLIPAPPGSFEVMGLMPDDTYVSLGYEVPGAYRPDWLAELLRRRAEHGAEGREDRRGHEEA